MSTYTQLAMAFTSRPAVTAWAAALLCLFSWSATAAAEDPAVQPMRKETLAIRDASGRCHRFRVELAQSPAQRTQGLSHRRALAEDAGMLFDFGSRDTQVSMWMKDTYLPLDMLFIRDDGSIARIARDTKPHSLEQIPSGEPVRAVLEINAGLASRLGLAAGDRVVHPMFAGAARYCVED